MYIFSAKIDVIKHWESTCLAESDRDLPLISTYIAELERAEKCARTIISYLHVPSYLIGRAVSAGNSRLSVYGTVNGGSCRLATVRASGVCPTSANNIAYICTYLGAPATSCAKLMSEDAEDRTEHGTGAWDGDRNRFLEVRRSLVRLLNLTILLGSEICARS